MRAAAVFVITLAASSQARAETEFLGGALKGMLDLRASATGGELGWAEGGLGKLRYGGHGDDVVGRLDLARGAVTWRPTTPWDVNGYVSVEIDPDNENAFDLDEAYLKWKPIPKSSTSTWVRLGAFFPPISLEHDGEAWSTTRTITPSAINTWVGEEVKVLGAEANVKTALVEGSLELTAATFINNDTSGTLLTYRGWALHDRQATLLGAFPLPTRYAASTEPFREIDDRPGYYARAEYRASGPWSLDIFHYDNAGDRRASDDSQSSWDTQFTNIGLTLRVAEGTTVLAQAMNGRTVWVPLVGMPIRYVDDLDFSSAYVLVDHEFESERGLAGRVDWFETRDNQAFNFNAVPEHGWSLTAAWRMPLSENVKFIVESVYVESERRARTTIGEDAHQEQLSAQASLRWTL
jgi:hypothetical protein